MKKILIVATALLLSACTTIKAIPAGTAYKVPGAYQVSVSKMWAEMPSTFVALQNGKLLSIDGPLLNSLQLVGNLPEGKSLIKSKSKEDPVPEYRNDMRATEIVEFVVDSLTRQGNVNVEAQMIRPAAFGASEGIRFDIVGAAQNGLSLKGTALFSQGEDGLNLILFMAPEEHYYGLHASEIENIMRSVTLI